MTAKIQRKNSFLLLEIFLAFTILTICLTTLSKTPRLYLLKEKNSLLQIELLRKQRVLYLDILQNIAKKHSLKSLSNDGRSPNTYELSPIAIRLEGFADSIYYPYYRIWRSKQGRKGPEGNYYYLINTKVFLGEKKKQKIHKDSSYMHIAVAAIGQEI